MEPSLPKQNESSLKGKKICLVEDDVFLAKILSQKLSTENAELIIYKSGEDALTGMEQNVPDIILLDVLLPGMDGFQVLETLRSKEATKKTPVLIISNTTEIKNQEHAKSLGAEFIIKALTTPYEIVERIKQTLH